MSPIRSLLAGLLTCAVVMATPGFSQSVLKIPSKILGEERTVLVSTPPGYAAGGDRYPVLYMTDGDAHLEHTRATVDFLARNGLIPNLVVVGITNTQRTRDLTPTAGRFRGEDGIERPVAGSGGAPRFLDFIEKEVFPAVESGFRVFTFRIFAGHSLGGLLALHILAERPQLFHGYIAASPSLNWDHDQPLRALEASLKGRKELQRSLFVSMANEEDGTPRPTRLDRLRGILKARQPGKFAWEVRSMPGEDHGSVVLASHYWGLRRIFDGWRPGGIDGAFEGSLADLKAHYARLGERLGIQVAAPEQAVNLAGYRALQRGRTDDALAIFRYNLELYPGSPNVHDSLGEGLERAGRGPEALERYRAAVDLAAKSGDPRLGLYVINRDRLTAKLAGKP